MQRVKVMVGLVLVYSVFLSLVIADDNLRRGANGS